MKSIVFLLFAIASRVLCRVSVSPDGSITLAASSAQGAVRVEGELVVSGRGIAQELASLQSTVTNANQLALYSLQALRLQKLTVPQARGSAFFTSNGDGFLVVANQQSGINNQYLYKWNRINGTFGPESRFSVAGPVNDFEVFTIGTTTYAVDANNNGGSQQCSFRAWDPSSQSFLLGNPVGVMAVTHDWGFVNTGARQYLAQATEQTATNGFFLWNGANFVSAGSTASTAEARDWNFFRIGSTWYGLACYSVGANSELVTFDGTNWVFSANIPTTEAYASDTFVVDNTTYLVIAEAKASVNGTVSEVYRWGGSSFTFQSNFLTKGARDVKAFTIGTQVYCFVTNVNDGVTNTVAPSLFKWNKYFQAFDPVSSANPLFLTNNDATYFNIDGKDYLHVVSAGDSFVYKLGIV